MIFYIDVIVPINIGKILTYHCDKKIEVGALVVVDVLNKTHFAIVDNISEEKPLFPTKPILQILYEDCYSEAFVKTIKWMSEYYFCPLGLVLKNFLPTFLKPDLPPSSHHETIKYEKPILSEAINFLITQLKSKDTVLFFSQDRIPSYIFFITKILNKGGVVVMLVPSDDYLKKILPSLQIFAQHMVIFFAEESKKKKIASWQRVMDRQCPLFIIGTKNILSLSLRKIDLLIIEDEQDELYIQDKNLPYYNARNVFLYFAKCLKTKIILGTNSPSITTLYNAQKKKYGFVKKDEIPKKVEINLCKVHMSNQIFTKRSLHEMKCYLDRGEQVMVLQNRLGYFDNLTCKKCGFCYICDDCSASLTFHKNENIFKCHHCGKCYGPIERCQCCGGSDFCCVEMGIEKVVVYLQEVWSDKKIMKIDADDIKRKKDREKIITDIEEADIIIGTRAIEGLVWMRVALLVVPDFDRLLTNSDFFTNEKLYTMIMRWRNIPNDKMIIQTSIPEHTIFKNLGDYEKFYTSEIEDRRRYKYPPFCNLVKVEYQNKDEQKLYKTIDKMMKELEEMGVDVLGSEKSRVFMIKKSFTMILWVIVNKNQRDIYDVLEKYDVRIFVV